MTDTPDVQATASDTTTTTSDPSGPTVRRRRRIATEPTDSAPTSAPAATPNPDAAAPAPAKRTRRIANSTPTSSRRTASGDTASGDTASGDGDAPKKRTRRVASSDPATREIKQREPRSPRTPRADNPAATLDTTADAASVPMPPAKPRIGDRRPAPQGDQAGGPDTASSGDDASGQTAGGAGRKRRRGGRGRGRGKGPGEGSDSTQPRQNEAANGSSNGRAAGGQQRTKRKTVAPIEAIVANEGPVHLDEAALQRRRGQERNGRPVGRYQMVAHVRGEVTHIAVLEGRTLIEHYVSRPADDVSQIHGNIYLGRVQNVLPGMEAAFVDIGTPKNAVLYRGDLTIDSDDVDGDTSSGGGRKSKGKDRHKDKDGPRIEELLKARQTIVCQVTKNPIAHKGARLTTEVSLPGRFVVLVPNSSTYGISKRLPDKERKRLRRILDRVKPAEHGLIVRTAAEDVTAEEIERDVARLHQQWIEIEKLAASTKAPALLFREPDMAVRIIREEFNKDYRGIIIDDRALYEQVKGYMETITPALADRIEYHDPSSEALSVFERFHVGEQLRKAVDRKVWLPSGGSLIIEHTEALTVIDVNTGKNVGSTNLEATVFANNLEAAEEIAKQLRLRDIGGIIVIDFIDMEIKANRDEVMRVFRDALARDKTRTQAFDITDLGLVEMTRKRIGEGLLESVTCGCDHCEGRGVRFLPDAIPE